MQANLRPQHNDPNVAWIDTKSVPPPVIRPDWAPEVNMDMLWNSGSAAVNELNKANNVIRTLRQNCQRLLETVVDLNPNESIAPIPHIYVPKEFSNTHPDALIIIMPVGLFPPNAMEWARTLYRPVTGKGQQVETALQQLVTRIQCAYDVIQMSPDGRVRKLSNNDPNFITLEGAMNMRLENPQLFRHPRDIPTNWILMSQRNKAMKSKIHEPHQETTGFTRAPQKKDTKFQKTKNQNINANVAGSDNRSSYIKSKERDENYEPDIRNFFYEHKGKDNPKLPRYRVFKLDLNRPIPESRFVKAAAQHYYLVNDELKIRKYEEDYERRMREREQKQANKPTLHLQQIRHLQKKQASNDNPDRDDPVQAEDDSQQTQANTRNIRTRSQSKSEQIINIAANTGQMDRLEYAPMSFNVCAIPAFQQYSPVNLFRQAKLSRQKT